MGATVKEPVTSGGIGSTDARTEIGTDRLPLLSIKVNTVGEVTRTVREPLRGTSPTFWSMVADSAFADVQCRTTSPPP